MEPPRPGSWPGRGAETSWSGSPAVACPTQTLAETRKAELQDRTLVPWAEAAGKEFRKRQVTPRTATLPLEAPSPFSAPVQAQPRPGIMESINQSSFPELPMTVNIHPLTAKVRAPWSGTLSSHLVQNFGDQGPLGPLPPKDL